MFLPMMENLRFSIKVCVWPPLFFLSKGLLMSIFFPLKASVNCRLFLLSSLILFSLPVYAQELPHIIIYGAQVPLEAPRVGSSSFVLTAEEIENRGLTTLPDALRLVPGMSVTSSGSRGSVTDIRIRGAESNHLVVFVDGVEVNAIDGEAFNAANLSLGDVERIEVIRGPQSGLYGANAHAGVIAIITKSGRGLKKPEGEITTRFGTRGARDVSGSVRASIGSVYGSASFNASREHGFNIARTGKEQDDSRASGFTVKAGADIRSDLNVETMFRYNKRFAQTDPQDLGTALTYDADAKNTFEDVAGRVAVSHRLWDDKVTQRASVSLFQQAYEYSLLGAQQFASDGQRVDLDYKLTGQHDTNVLGGEKHTLTVGMGFRHEDFTSTSITSVKERQRLGLFADYILDLPTQTTLGLSARHDWNNPFKSATSWRATVSQRFSTGTRLHASLGTGITNPTFYELFGVSAPFFFGNPNLKPEQSTGFDLGVEQNWMNGSLLTDVTFFSTRFKDQIAYSFPTMVNVAGTSTREGLEVSATVKPFKWLDLQAGYTFLLAERANGIQEIRRPKHSGSVTATARFLEDRGRLTVGLDLRGDTRDTWFVFPAQNVTLKPITNLSARLSYDVTKQATVFVQGSNLLNQKREEVFSYRLSGLEAKAGLTVRFGH
jgi:vitamin B12 transporter